ncbi:MAG: hypothetical protein A3C90_04260 [Candidatus Magasanikbacteria bacterium RIFCSPHIGHO2_02_FULL_51_14]|uniref:Uncharacterized protein n=1 Tax=Candidatus Magasanikbacteria bacterium RIFCSPHIGHO2_02_FULL_51_14 TaxID=1798683 RepID=A0A1F6MG13_9BACT|nr:MAG: hypothetical protein A3C90_04260 [Candidatus Magasanikbacteria bacterium RIFCSPHIGHO2_02_FULL_51_14]
MLNYQELLGLYPWIVERDHDCILSPDSDGLLCGLFMSHYLGWHIRGYYDGNVLLHDDGVDPKKCVFLDMEIYRHGVQSVGQHLLLFDKKNVHSGWSNFDECISANGLRQFDYKHDFSVKYPFGTIHLLLALVGQILQVVIPKSAVCPLLYTDGTFKNQFNYPENCIDWLQFLGAEQEHNPLQKIFLDRNYSTYELMVELKDFFEEIKNIGGGKRGGDKIKISNSKGVSSQVDIFGRKIHPQAVSQAKRFLSFLSQKTGWDFRQERWRWDRMNVVQFESGNMKPGKARFNDLLEKKPLSFAITSGINVSFTLDPDRAFGR